MKDALLRTLPGRAIVIGLAIKVAVFLLASIAGGLPAFVGVVDTVASVAIAAGGAYFLFRALAFVKRRLLWRVRRKLIISYIFIGFIPAILIVAFFLLGGLLLFSNFSSYLVQSRLRMQRDRAQSIGVTTALEIQRAGGRAVAAILAQRQAAAAREFPGASLAVAPIDRQCDRVPSPASAAAGAVLPVVPVAAGPWAHVEPPTFVPDWITCAGFTGLLIYSSEDPKGQRAERAPTITIDNAEVPSPAGTHLLVRAVALPDSPRPGFAVIVDLPVNGPVLQQLRGETGVELTGVTLFGDGAWLQGRVGGEPDVAFAVSASQALPGTATIVERQDWTTGVGGTVIVWMQLSIRDIYDKISAAQGSNLNRSVGQGLLLVLIGIGVLFLVIEAMALATGLALAKSITGSVHELFTGTEQVRQGDFTHKIAVKANDQLGELAESFNSMTASIEDLLRQAAEKKRLEEELRIAHEIQMSLLPQGPLRMAGLSVTALCVPAREVGGDYYDFLPLDDHRVGVLIADVSGKGTSAALYMAELKGLMLSLCRIHTSPRELLITANRIIAKHLDARSFITMTYAVLDLRARTMTYARAGHTPLIYVPGPGPEGHPRRVQILAPDGLVVGLKIDQGQLFESLLEEETIPLKSGDLYLFFTDGISEAMNEDDDCFGEQRLGQLVETQADLPPDQLRERMLREIEAFVGGAPQHDDMTMILLKVEDIGAALPAMAAEPVGVAQVK